MHLLAVLPADEGIAGSRFLDKRHILAVSRRFRPRFAVQQDICDRERLDFPNSRERHVFIDGDLDFSVFSGRIAFPLLVLPACKQIPFLCGRFEGDGRALLHRLAAASAYAAVRVDFDAHRVCFIRSDKRQWSASLLQRFHHLTAFRGLMSRVIVLIPVVNVYAAVVIHIRGDGQFDCRSTPFQTNICSVFYCMIVVNPICSVGNIQVHIFTQPNTAAGFIRFIAIDHPVSYRFCNRHL